MNPRFPIYIISKGRWERKLTHDALTAMRVPHFMVVEADEIERYAAAGVPRDSLIELFDGYKDDYDPCDEFGRTKPLGSGPARNFVWDHAMASGADAHWIMDDNLDGFFRLNQNLKTPVETGAIFRAMEDFSLRFEKVGLSGPNYHFFAKRKQLIPPFVANTRIYSCILINHELPLRWRCRYNEDTDLSLRALKLGFRTIQFNAFLSGKVATQSMAGGNTTELYAQGTLAKSEMIARLHPDVARVTDKFGRDHHQVDYSGFRRLALTERDPEARYSPVDEYGMELQQNVGGRWVKAETGPTTRKSRYAPSVSDDPEKLSTAVSA